MIKFSYDKNWMGGHTYENLIEKILSLYDAEDCIYGLFSALVRTNPRVSAFIATHSYCMRLESAAEGLFQINASPIYHLGPEYPNEYKEKHGTELDKDAIVGLIELPAGDQAHKTFSLGIDAGIVFKGSRISHNQKLSLEIKSMENGLFATLSCESQTTSKMFSWSELGAHSDEQKKVAVTV